MKLLLLLLLTLVAVTIFTACKFVAGDSHQTINVERIVLVDLASSGSNRPMPQDAIDPLSDMEKIKQLLYSVDIRNIEIALLQIERLGKSNNLRRTVRKLLYMYDWLLEHDAIEEAEKQDDAYKILQVQQLGLLKVTGFKLKKLPYQLCAMENLDQLVFSNNQLDNLPRNLENLPKVDNIALCYNNFSTLPESLLEMQELKLIFLIGNPITKDDPFIKKLIEKGVEVNFKIFL